MKILVLGGTRFLGKLIVNILVGTKDVEVIVLSRRDFKNFKGKEIIISEKEDGLRKINGACFDVVIDFIAYDLNSVKLVYEFLKFRKYILISTCWLNKLNHSCKMNEIIENVDLEILRTLPEITKDYLMGKNEIENFLINEIKNNSFSIIRLPIILGHGDHTKRLNFYIDRVRDGKRLILVNDGRNHCQIADVRLVAQALASYILKCFWYEGFLFEALPNHSVSIKKLVSMISVELNVPLKSISISSERLKELFPEYLEKEPFWHEVFFHPTNDNLFKMFEVNNKQGFDKWLGEEIKRLKSQNYFMNSEIRNLEINFIKKYY